MIKQTPLVLGIALAMLASLPAHAWQHRGGGGQRAGTTAGQRGTMQQDRDRLQDRLDQDRLQDRDRTRDRLDQDRLQDRDRTRDRDRLDDGTAIYGSQLMTQSERDAYRSKMRSLSTTREREELRAQHHTEMQQRAKERGVTLPDEPPAGGGRMNSTQQRTQQQTEQQERTQEQGESGQQTRQQTEQQQRTQQQEEQRESGGQG